MPERTADQIIDILTEGEVLFNQLCEERHLEGQKKYGEFTFLENDVIRMTMEELADTSNYCRMQFMKLHLLQKVIAEQTEGFFADGKQEMTIGVTAFKGTKDVGWKKG